MSDSAEVVARAFVEAINRQDVKGLAGLMTPEHRFVDSLGNAVEGREKMRAGWVGYFSMVPDYSIVVEEIYCHPSEQKLLAGDPDCDGKSLKAGPSTPLRSAQDDKQNLLSAQDVVMLGKARGTYSTDGTLKVENRWETPAAWRAVVVDGLVAEWRVYADNEPMRELMRRAR